MGSACKKTDVSTSTTTPDALGKKAGENILKAADSYYATPYKPYTDPMVAPLTGNHQAGINSIASYAASNPTAAATGAAKDIYGADVNMTTQPVQTRDVTAGSVDSEAYRMNPANFATNLDITQMAGNYGVDPNAYKTAGDYTTDVNMGRVNGQFQVNPAQYGANGSYDVSTDLARTTGDYGVDVAGYGAIGADGKTQAEALSPWVDPNSTQRIVDENGPLGAVADYQNPMTQAMLDPAVREVQDAAARERNRIGAGAMQSGAFGDARHGVLERGLNEDVMQTIGDMTSAAYGKSYADAMALRQADRAAGTGGFQTALAGRSDDLGRALSADTTNRQIALTADTGNVERGLAAADANANRDLTADQFNANLGSSLDIFNQQMGFEQETGNVERQAAIDAANRDRQYSADSSNADRLSGLDVFNQQQGYAQEEGNVARASAADQANVDRAANIAANDAAMRAGIDVGNVDRAAEIGVGNANRGVDVGQFNAGMDAQTQQANVEADMARAAGMNQTATTEQQLFMQQLEAQMSAGNVEQQNQQNQYDVAYQEFLRQQADPANRLSNYAGAIAGAPMGSTTVQETPQQGYPFLQAVGSIFGAVMPGFR